MPKEKEKREHKFLNKHTILGVILLMYGSFLFIEFVVGFPVEMVLEKFGCDKDTGLGIGAIIGSLLALFIWFRFFSPEYKWKPQEGEWSKTFRLLSPILIYWVLIFGMYGIFAKGFPFGAIGASLFTAIMAGIAEEVAFREIGISYLARQWKDESKIIMMAVIPSAAFALIHVTNYVETRDLTSSLLQALLTFFFGIFYSAIYLRTGNIWPLIIAHSLHDILSFSASVGAAAKGAQFPEWIIIAIVLVEVILLVCGLYMLRKSKRAEIIALWDRKWSRGAAVAEETAAAEEAGEADEF